MIDLNNCIEFGQITKSHGIKGEVQIKLHGNLSFNNILKMELLFFIVDGLPVPFFISEYTEKPPDSLFIKFDTIDSEDTARKYADINTYIPKKHIRIQHTSSPVEPNLTGFQMNDIHLGTVGVIRKISNIKENPLFEVINLNNEELLIPANADYILKIDKKRKIIETDLPKGLLGL